ncbi:AraC family transcriptional regulator [Photobacterium phosphoreum]|uniref:AraC family transcriptional regulator n=1 Tax=Photobacterium phosphoreum TaxID=659 RepID=UPI0005D337B7|nr:AraC family transcriptional regulator [Photobacterium phosphoreum]KJF86140.1 AraC family transcriptional regulator [Photobacterium phosphoreum]OBU33566.1 AraC family transcriptional regulator [Photobacterium phosphoreum]PQJ86587.1 AraC family transcriptional regulator [Photobacterium phosphoreum]PSU58812.1 AraC family transcriptional regulator [Photobacterium phosphoreum]PSU84507.1 AraC family transcriptional regulator [Photobacterium phosphoreum]
MINIAFIRTAYLKPLELGLQKHYGIRLTELGIPAQLLKEPTSLIPFNDYLHWLERIKMLTGDPAYMIKMATNLTFENIGPLGHWYVSCPDLALAFRRINYGISCLQGGASYHGEQSGKIVKWVYNNSYAHGSGASFDSLKVAILFTQVSRNYMGDDYMPVKIELYGPEITDPAIQQFFGCPITWQAPATKVWLNLSILEHGNQRPLPITKPILVSNLQLDDLLNMPQPQDIAKVMFEMINYSRYYGFPTLDFVAEKVGLSRQQLQRRLHDYGWTFTGTTNYILCNLAIKYMLSGMDISTIATILGYSNVQSFNKAFKRNRGLTPAQYQHQLLERSLN